MEQVNGQARIGQEKGQEMKTHSERYAEIKRIADQHKLTTPKLYLLGHLAAISKLAEEGMEEAEPKEERICPICRLPESKWMSGCREAHRDYTLTAKR